MSYPYLITDHVIDAQYMREYPRATASQDTPLKLCIKQYAPIDNPDPKNGDLTIVAAHGTGFPKELYEPLWEDLYARSRKEGFNIGSIWIADATNQGVSGIANEAVLGNDPSAFDHSRDLLLMMNHFRHKMTRPIMGVGHSLGATQLIFLSLMHPRILQSLILIEPYIIEKNTDADAPLLVHLTKHKRDVWPSRAAAEEKARQYLRSWDSRVLERWFQWGYRELPTAIYPNDGALASEAPVTLTTTKFQEALIYARANPHRHKELGIRTENTNGCLTEPPHDPLFFPDVMAGLPPGQQAYRPEPIVAGKLLPHLRPSALFLSGASSPLFKSGLHTTMAERTGSSIGGSGGVLYDRVRHLWVKGAGHALPLEKVDVTANTLGEWIQKEMERWRTDEDRIAAGWEDLSPAERSRPTKEWEKVMAESLAFLRNTKGAKL
ncbi:toxin biosynthesis protein [Aspergillus vadensis CBS 113365]|uniref:Toxin biosynthesis protein n=1 Tax=Aspergillus vadensis (strain CBS 113365 / IMI 142717 / IBT 24658) TaxID=1448311 RepID=A0A319C4G1_ASPVC|nr:toxin biosynthesis protein [Aspergillus vadensis CBS 113365]PYH73173.1 toxin biosynthesis protein [Aspergillus vadensis CBS 113365]